MSATLADLAARWPGTQVVGDPDLPIEAITHDSRSVGAGMLFACVRGAVADGHDFAPSAVAQGAVALLVDHRLDWPEADVAQLVVDDVRRAMGPIAAAVNHDPSRSLSVVGVTGTNGKTSVVWLIGHVLGHVGRPHLVQGTLTGPRTTPESPDLQATLADARAAGIEVVAMEVSSHALALHRVDGTHFRVGVFTNLGHDHLDFHGDVESYEAAKTLLFSSRFLTTAVINRDDAAGRRIAAQCDVPVRDYGIGDAEDLRLDGPISHFRWRGHEVVLRLPGVHNVLNALAAATACVELGIDPLDIAVALDSAEPARGRFEMVDVGRPFSVVVDFAHKPEALRAVLIAAGQIVGSGPSSAAATGTGRVIVVFGCGGDRDASKRPVMGAVAVEHADLVYLTSDNPRTEDPESILDAVECGIDEAGRTRVRRIADRAAAIRAALDEAVAGDVVLIAGKGDETVQIVGSEAFPFDDREVAIDYLLGAGANLDERDPA